VNELGWNPAGTGPAGALLAVVVVPAVVLVPAVFVLAGVVAVWVTVTACCLLVE
jgi:hypothetical protein